MNTKIGRLFGRIGVPIGPVIEMLNDPCRQTPAGIFRFGAKEGLSQSKREQDDTKKKENGGRYYHKKWVVEPSSSRNPRIAPTKGRSMYGSNSVSEIFQRKPPFSKPSQFKLKSWTDTIAGYQHEAKKLTTCILKIRKLLGRPYRWFVTIYIWDVMPPKEAAALWTKVCRNLRRQGLVALWVREPTKKNKIHYHLLVSSGQTEQQLLAAVEASMPSRKTAGWHKSIDPVDNRWWLAFYITKAKIQGRYKGNVGPDKYATKRLLFKPGTKLKKHGTIGKFWLKSTKAIWKDVQDKEKKIAEGLADERIRNLAKHVHELINGYYPLKTIERNFGYSAQSPAVQDWIAALDAEEPFMP